MTFEIRLKAGFFRTQVYYLTIDSGQIFLIPQEQGNNDRIAINDEELQSITIINNNRTSAELEIVTTTNTYIGSLATRTDLKQLAGNLDQEFGVKFILQR